MTPSTRPAQQIGRIGLHVPSPLKLTSSALSSAKSSFGQLATQAKVVARALRDAGIEVVYTGLHQTPDQIAAALMREQVAVATAQPFATTPHTPRALRLALGSVDLPTLRSALGKVRWQVQAHA